MHISEIVPYCGNAPVPGNLRWNFDPALILVLSIIAVLYFVSSRTQRSASRREQLAFSCGLIITAGALLSPLCNLSVALFSARVTQHMVLTLVAAPLLVLGRGGIVFSGVFGGQRSMLRSQLADVPLWL